MQFKINIKNETDTFELVNLNNLVVDFTNNEMYVLQGRKRETKYVLSNELISTLAKVIDPKCKIDILGYGQINNDKKTKEELFKLLIDNLITISFLSVETKSTFDLIETSYNGKLWGKLNQRSAIKYKSVEQEMKVLKKIQIILFILINNKSKEIVDTINKYLHKGLFKFNGYFIRIDLINESLVVTIDNLNVIIKEDLVKLLRKAKLN